MAQKINPISFRLGAIQIWNSTLQTYGKSYNYYFFILHKYLRIYQYLIQFFNLNNFLLIYQEWILKTNKIYLNIHYSILPFVQNNICIVFFKRVIILITRWFSEKVLIRFFLRSSQNFSLDLVNAYVQYLISLNISQKKIIWNLCKFLEVYLNSSKIIYFRFGFVKLRLKGFKICLVGRFDNSKNQMASTIEQTVGYLPLASLKSYVEYSTKELFMKSGVCGLQIWFFYEFY